MMIITKSAKRPRHTKAASRSRTLPLAGKIQYIGFTKPWATRGSSDYMNRASSRRSSESARPAIWGELLSCGYCLSHWVAAALVLAYQPRLFWFWWPVDYLFTTLVVAWLSAFHWGALCLLMEKAGK